MQLFAKVAKTYYKLRLRASAVLVLERKQAPQVESVDGETTKA